MLTWFLPSLYGDIRLTSQGEKRTLLTIHGLSPEEQSAMKALLRKAEKPGVLRAPWCSKEELSSLSLTDTVREQKLVLQASILDVEKVLSTALKPTRKKLSAVRFAGGKIEEVTERTIGLIQTTLADPSPDEKSPDTARSADVSSATTPASPTPKPSKGPVAATVAAPVRGCPAPDFSPAEVRATRVMMAFLTPDQIRDFEEHQAFIAVGADTGHRYQLTSRHARDELVAVRRTLFDLDEMRPWCVHDWEVPAAEELLAIFLCLAIPGREHYVRSIPEDDFIAPGYNAPIFQ